MRIDKKIDNRVSAVVIVVIALAIPAFYLRGVDWSKFEVNAFSILVPMFYVVFIAGFVLLALGKQGQNFTSKEKDKQIADAYKSIRQKLKPFVLVFVICWIAWVGYLLLTLYAKV
jgi:uncharacterized membrane protein YbjE (DUF340 family)